MFGAIAKAVFGSSNDRYVKSLDKIVRAIGAFEPDMQALSDDDLRAQTTKFRAMLADGKTLEIILAELGHVAEGVNSAQTTLERAKAYQVDMPITAAVNAVLFENANPRETVKRLLSREARTEVR